MQTSLTDLNGLVTSWTYDDFGRLTLETRPDNTDTTLSIQTCGSCESRVKYFLEQKQRKIDDSVIRTDQAFFDRFDRPVHEYQQMPGGGFSDVVVQFDARGRVIRQDVPYWGSATPTGTTGTNGYAEFVYDLLDRVTAERLRTSAGALDRQVSHDYNGLSSTSTDPKTHQTTRWAHAWGDLARVTDAGSGNTNYQYNAFGQLTQVTDALGNVTTSVGYNVRGMKTSSTDMDMGSWTFLPNALGELERIRDAKTVSPAWTTIIGYDALGRMTSRQDVPEASTTTLTFGTAATSTPTNKNIGRLISASAPVSGYSEILTYDNKARLVNRAITTDTSYQIDQDYDALTGLPATLTYPTSTSGYRFKLQYEYDYGVLSKIKRFDSPFTEYWKLNVVDARGHVLDEDLGGGPTPIKVVSGFEPLTGLIDYRRTGVGGGTSIQNLAYDWDLNGNLSQRQDQRQTLTELFTYDALNRVDIVKLNGNQTLDVDYDLIGNITKKTDVSPDLWTYHATKKHAVTATGTGGPTYGYDANGNVTSKSGASISWYSFNLPNVINGSGVSSQFWYGPDRQRFKHVANFTSGTETAHYVGGILEKLVTATNTHYKHFIAGPTGLVATYTRRASGSPIEDTFYFTKDHLGSIDSVTNASGTPQVRLSFDAFGKRRNEAGWSGSVPPADWTAIANTTRRGYTEHEHLDNLALIHMNGRVYDPTIGRFLSADPYVQAPFYSQSLNRYSYVWNNPLTLIDPSGFQTDDEGGGFRFGFGFGGSWPLYQRNHYPPPHYQPPPRRDSPVGRDTAVRSSTVFLAAGTIALPASEVAAEAARQAADKAIRAAAAAGRFAITAAGTVAGVAVGVLIPNNSIASQAEEEEGIRKDNEAQKAVSVADQSVNADPNQFEPDDEDRKYRTPTDRYKEQLTPRTLDAARRELRGEIVRLRPDGTAFDHVQKVRNAQQGLLNRVQQINRRLGHPSLSEAERSVLRNELSEASRLLDLSEAYVPR